MSMLRRPTAAAWIRIVALCGMMAPVASAAATRLTGRAIDGRTLDPVSGARLLVEIQQAKHRDFATTDAAGSFTLDFSGLPEAERRAGVAWVSFEHDHYLGRFRLEFRNGQSTAVPDRKLTKRGGEALRSSCRDSLSALHDPTGRMVGFADFDLDTAGVVVDAGLIRSRLIRRLDTCIRTNLQENGVPAELCRISISQLPCGLDLFQEQAAREAGVALNALALIGGELRIRPGTPGPTLRVSGKFFPIPRAGSIQFTSQTIEDLLNLDPQSPSSIASEAGLVWAQQAGIALGLREMMEGAGDRERLRNAGILFRAVQSTLPAGDGPIQRWLGDRLREIDASIGGSP